MRAWMWGLAALVVFGAVLGWWLPSRSGNRDVDLEHYLSELTLAQQRYRGFHAGYSANLEDLSARGLPTLPEGMRLELVAAEQDDFCARARRTDQKPWVFVTKQGVPRDNTFTPSICNTR
jgi:hypothetical protein